MPAYSVTNPVCYLIHVYLNRRIFTCQPLLAKNVSAYFHNLKIFTNLHLPLLRFLHIHRI